ncbi:hypothetical protein WICMUC_000668 [Wickerhamomyces mucosus]|uniref:HORMA domain-containing protein n=1 Tax=Wickerhamomyces mucosus TaxID=1378264 RepID=A0A9P8TIJ3_9ASCO|nr:hypothetical protein WICMUC_000668 [Wickerhamomyces mucosus]
MSPPTRSSISFRGSSQIISEFFEYSVNSILYQRGIYPSDDFKSVKKYGLTLLVTHDEDIKAYIRKFMTQLHKWIINDKVSTFVLVIVNKNTGETVERWQFNIAINQEEEGEQSKQKSIEDIQREIQAIIRQITASVTFLPTLEVNDYTFNILVYADSSVNLPNNNEWIDSQDSKLVNNSESVKFKSFSTNEHKIDTLVSYKLDK